MSNTYTKHNINASICRIEYVRDRVKDDKDNVMELREKSRTMLINNTVSLLLYILLVCFNILMNAHVLLVMLWVIMFILDVKILLQGIRVHRNIKAELNRLEKIHEYYDLLVTAANTTYKDFIENEED